MTTQPTFDEEMKMTFEDPFDRFRSSTLRASDAEREQATDALRRHHGEGRITDDEFEERVAAAYQARTVGELDRLLADLPRGDRGLSTRPPAWGLSRAGRLSPLRLAVAAIALLWLLGAALGALFGGPYGFHHPHPPLIVPLVLAFVVWRLVVRRRRRSWL